MISGHLDIATLRMYLARKKPTGETMAQNIVDGHRVEDGGVALPLKEGQAALFKEWDRDWGETLAGSQAYKRLSAKANANANKQQS